MKNKPPLLISSRQETLSIEHLRSRKRFSTYSEAQLQHLLHTLKTFAHIVYRIWAKNKKAAEAQAVSTNETTIVSPKPDTTKQLLPHQQRKAA